jgi:hypothetical protein
MTAAQIRVLVHDYANAPAEVLDQARAHVARIYHAIGVEIVWLELPDVRQTTLRF